MVRDESIYGKILYQDETHKFVWLGADPEIKAGVVQTNQYLINDKGRGILLDPGGIHLFSRVVAAASRYISLEKIDTIIFSHQDPDVSSGIALWLGVTPSIIYISQLWMRFLPHFGIIDEHRIKGIEVSDKKLSLPSGSSMIFLPAHFMHSLGNYSVYDERSKILFSGDIGAAVFKPGEEYLFVEDFDKHISLMKPFHSRYMVANKVCRKWVDTVSKFDVQMIAPQHGAIFRGEDVNRFLNWLSELPCGVDNLEEIYG